MSVGQNDFVLRENQNELEVQVPFSGLMWGSRSPCHFHLMIKRVVQGVHGIFFPRDGRTKIIRLDQILDSCEEMKTEECSSFRPRDLIEGSSPKRSHSSKKSPCLEKM